MYGYMGWAGGQAYGLLSCNTLPFGLFGGPCHIPRNRAINLTPYITTTTTTSWGPHPPPSAQTTLRFSGSAAWRTQTRESLVGSSLFKKFKVNHRPGGGADGGG